MIIHRKRLAMLRGRPKFSLSLGMVFCAVLLLNISSSSVLAATCQGIKIESIVQNWTTEETTEVNVCLSCGQRLEQSLLTQYDLLITNDLGKSWRTRGVLQKTDRRLCFPGVTLEKEDFAKTLTYTVTESGGNELIEEVETFLIVPKITPMSQDIYEICWENPGDLTFFLKQEESETQQTAPFTCERCCRYLISQSPGDLVTLETAGTKDSFARQLVQVRLPENLPKSKKSLIIKELHKVSRDDDPSGREQNMKVYLDPNEPPEADHFTLYLVTSENQIPYAFYKKHDAAVIEFSGNFVDSNHVIIKAEKDGAMTGFGYVSRDIADPGSRVARVGDSSAPSLRVDPGARGQVDVPDKTPCAGGSGPCYYVGQTAPLPPLCDNFPDIIFCDAVVSEVQNPTGAPALELRNRQELRVQQPRPDGARTEVVVSRDGSILSPPDDFGCDDLGDGICSQPVAVADDLDGFDVTLVVLDGDGYVTASLAVPFEVHGVVAFSLSSDVLQVEVDPRSRGTYEVTLPDLLSPPAVTVECQAGSPCRVWFAGVEAPPSVSVKKESNTVYEDISAGPPTPASRVERLTSRGADASMDVEVATGRPVTRANLVTFSSDVATDADCESLAATPLEFGFSVAAASRDAGEWNFLVVGYGDGEVLLEAGRAKVTLSAMDSRVGVVGSALGSPDASVRVDVGSLDDVSVEGVGSCAKPDSPCYFLTEALTAGTLRHCVTIANSAGGGSSDVSQCDVSFTPFKPMVQEPMLELVDRTILKVTPETSNFHSLEVVAFNPQTDDLLSKPSPLCTPEPGGSCIQEVDITEGLLDFRVLVVGVDAAGETQESVLSPFYDFMTHAQHFNNGTDLEVRWRTSSEQTFSISIEDDVSGGFTKTSIACGQDPRTCKAYFTKLSTEVAHKVKVTKDETAVSVSVQPGQDATTPLSITRISKVSTLRPQAQLTISSAVDVEAVKYLEYVVIEPPVGSDIVQHIAFADFSDIIHTGNTITFEDVEAPKTGVEVTVMVIAHAGDGADSDALAFGKVLITFEDIKLPIMTKVGTEAFQSLKVETRAMAVNVNGVLCEASTICYDLEPHNILEPPEVCRNNTPTVEQCDMTAAYVQPEALIDPSVQLSFTGQSEEDLTVAAEFSETSLTVEAKLYIGLEDLTPEPLTCDITGQSTKICAFKVEPKVTEFKILLMVLDAQTIVVQSHVVEFEDFQTRIRQLTSNAIEVRWRASQNQEYDVEIFPEVKSSFSNTSVLCGGEKPEDSDLCLAYFIALDPTENYTASVRTRNSEMSVLAVVQMEARVEALNITELTLAKTEDASTELNVCFIERQLAENEARIEEKNLLYKLVAVDATGRQLRMTSNSSLVSSSVLEGKLCLGPLPLDFDFDLSDKVRILVTQEDLDTDEVVAGDVGVFLLDLRQVDVRQVGAKTVRAKWTNNNGALSFDVGIGVDDLFSVECGVGGDAEEECLRYLHVESTSKQVTVTLREIGLSVDQQVEVTLTLRDFDDIQISKTDLTWDGRLRVCFEPNSMDSLYFLALENEEGAVQEVPQLRPYVEDGLTCVLSNDAMQTEGYVSLWALLTAFDVSGAVVQASGNTNVTDFFLSSRRRVSAALNADTHDLLVSWFLLSDPRTISSYDVTLEETTADGTNELVTVGNTESSHVFNGTKAGRYCVCVVAYVKENNVTSQKVCSAILSILQSDVAVPGVPEPSLKSSAPTKVLVTWQKPQADPDVSSYVITWSSSTSFSPTPTSPSSSNLSSPVHSVLHPLGLIRRASPLSDDDQDLSFVVVPSSTTSVEVDDLTASQSYKMCVSSVKSDVIGSQSCSDVNQEGYQPLEVPKDLALEDEALHWPDVIGAAKYQVEWRPRYEGGLLEGGLEEVTGTTWLTQDLAPGAWVVEVRAASDTSVSEAATIRISKIGIAFSQTTQTSNSQLEVSWWEEPVPSCAQTPCKYIITLFKTKDNYIHYCSGQRGDCTKLLDVKGASEIVVEVKREASSSLVSPRVFTFEAVAELRQSFSSGGEAVTLSWAETKGAKLYNVTLFADAASASVRRTEMISRQTYILKGSDLVGSVFQVQPCADKYHCGDPRNITLQEISDVPPRDDTVVILVSVIGGVVAVIVIVAMVALALRETAKNKERDKIRQREEAAMSFPVYNEWGARPLGRPAQPPPQASAYNSSDSHSGHQRDPVSQRRH
ncbi:uncharacterized protein LOC125028302 [Penaeus chinensis]|uniref:uncharacterized protein LOC125028302 n=1 Tax=Penaeus chinensis TaxID=139456 RepID=UPI001FB57AE4|nr:uncharacterized protein LOC125028302 [Penaeus chinensis]